MESEKWWEIVLNISPTEKKKYNPCGNGNELWAHSGKIVPLEEQKNSKYENHIFEFSNQTEDRGYPWRSCMIEGQLPHFLYWPL